MREDKFELFAESPEAMFTCNECYKSHKAAYLAGYKAGQEEQKRKDVEIVRSFAKSLKYQGHMRDFTTEGYNDACDDIADAIERGGEE